MCVNDNKEPQIYWSAVTSILCNLLYVTTTSQRCC